MSGRHAVMIMAGGTGGTCFPASRWPRRCARATCEVVWLGTARPRGAARAAHGIPIEWLASGLRGKGVPTLSRAVSPAAASCAARRACAQRGRGCGRLGGFVAGPGGVAAWLTRRR